MSEADLLAIAGDLAAGVLPDLREARLLGILLSGFGHKDADGAQLSLFFQRC